MRYVLDSSVAIKWVLPEINSDKAIRLRDDFQNGLCQLIAVDVFPVEVGHALTRAERQLRITVGDAEDLWNEVMADAPWLIPSLPLMPRALRISPAERIGVYDCLYIALAEAEGCKLITEDVRLSSLKSRFLFIVMLNDLP